MQAPALDKAKAKAQAALEPKLLMVQALAQVALAKAQWAMAPKILEIQALSQAQALESKIK